MKQVLVTGGAGFIGSHLCERLLRQGYGVINLDNFNPYYDPKRKWKHIQKALEHPNYHLYVGDIRDDRPPAHATGVWRFVEWFREDLGASRMD